MPGSPVNKYSLENMANNYGMTPVGLGLAIQRLRKKEFIQVYQEGDPYNDEIYQQLVFLEESGWNWIDKNDNIFRLEKDKKDEKGDP